MSTQDEKRKQESKQNVSANGVIDSHRNDQVE